MEPSIPVPPKGRIAMISGHIDISDSEFATYYHGLIDEAIANGDRFILGDASGTDQLALDYILQRDPTATARITVYASRADRCKALQDRNIDAVLVKALQKRSRGRQRHLERDAEMTNASDYDILWSFIEMGLLLVLQQASPGAIAIVLLLATVSFLLFRGAYYAFFHPLAKIPGPKLYAATSLPYFLHLLRGDWHNTLKGMHDRYGPAVRFTPNDVSFITTDAFKQIYGHKSSLEATFMKDPPFYKRGLKHSTIINANHEDHKRFRRLLSHAFSEKALRSQEDILTFHPLTLCHGTTLQPLT
ncbi:hypothetical protein NM208_g8845 [Fusarium decemcellulare]|uniref:Uncharacterized protein n=1 Tax=Fusarium decemcellulare TaxID=57161 RepID=A0ACC1S3R7_9HYPO|nr:hypothetical protein NM208_g8845 [Fusarium decemcellulare]